MKSNLLKPGSSLVIFGSRCKDLVNVNDKTYFSAVALVNGKEVARIEFSEGAGHAFLDDMTAVLEEKKFIAPYPTHNTKLEKYCQNNGITLFVKCVDVARKKDL